MAVSQVRLDSIGKRYSGTKALDNVSVEVVEGTVHALVGANGAGKSTLGKIIGGVIRPDDGQMFVNNLPVRYSSPREARIDGIVTISGCDKTIPAMTMVLGRLNIPGLMLYCGSIMFGRCVGTTGPFANRNLTIQDVFEAIGAYNAGKISAAELKDVEDHACPGAGACGGQFTANTMATAYEMLGMSPMGWNGVPAIDPRKEEVAFESGKAVSAKLNWGEAKAPMLAYALIYAGTGLDNSANILGPEVTRMVNEFTTKKCAKLKDDTPRSTGN